MNLRSIFLGSVYLSVLGCSILLQLPCAGAQEVSPVPSGGSVPVPGDQRVGAAELSDKGDGGKPQAGTTRQLSSPATASSAAPTAESRILYLDQETRSLVSKIADQKSKDRDNGWDTSDIIAVGSAFVSTIIAILALLVSKRQQKLQDASFKFQLKLAQLGMIKLQLESIMNGDAQPLSAGTVFQDSNEDEDARGKRIKLIAAQICPEDHPMSEWVHGLVKRWHSIEDSISREHDTSKSSSK